MSPLGKDMNGLAATEKAKHNGKSIEAYADRIGEKIRR
jgi:hypothetical protein